MFTVAKLDYQLSWKNQTIVLYPTDTKPQSPWKPSHFMSLYDSVKWQYLTLFIDRENAKLVNATFRLPKAQPSISPSPSLQFYSFISKYMDQRQNNQCLRWICRHPCMQKSCSQFVKINRKLVWIYYLSPLTNRPFNDFSLDRQLYCEQIFKVHLKA